MLRISKHRSGAVISGAGIILGRDDIKSLDFSTLQLCLFKLTTATPSIPHSFLSQSNSLLHTRTYLSSIRKHGPQNSDSLCSSSNPSSPLCIASLARLWALLKLHPNTLLTQLIQYSMYGHIAKLAEAEKAGIEAAGGKADVYQWVPIPIPTIMARVGGSLSASQRTKRRS